MRFGDFPTITKATKTIYETLTALECVREMTRQTAARLSEDE